MGLNLESTISLNSASFERGMHRVKDSVSESVKGFVIGAIGVATVEQAFRRTIETAEELVNTAKRLGTTVEQVQLLRQAAKDAGTEMDSVATALEKINLARAKALGGNKSATAAFSALGVSKGDLKTKTAADLFMHQIGDTVKRVSPEQIAQPLREVLGRGAGQGIAVLKTDFEELGKEMNLMSSSTSARLKVFADEIDLVSQEIIVALAPAILIMLQACIAFSAWVGGKVASAATWLGALSVGAENSAASLDDPANKSHADAIRRAGNANAGMTADSMFNDAKSQANAAGDKFAEWLKKFNEKLERAEAGLKSPKPDFNAIADTAQKMKGGGKIASDSLVKVGNFLGSNIGAVHAAARMEQHAVQTNHFLYNIEIMLRKAISNNFKLPENNYHPPSLDSSMKWANDSLMNVPNNP